MNTATIATQVARAPNDELKIEMFFSRVPRYTQQNLGRLRLAVTDEADVLVRTRVRKDLKDSEVVDLCIALAKAYAQQGRTNETVASFTEALPVATDRTGKAKIIAESAPLDGVLEKLTERAAGDGQFQAELARYFAERGNAQSAEAARAKARTLFEEKLAKEPENAALAVDLADVLLIDTGSKWTVLKPTEMKSQGGATLTVLDDHSVLVGGVNPIKETFTFVTQTHLPKIKALRREALAHESLANGGPGRSPWGNFALSEISVKAEPRSGASKATVFKLINPRADFEQDKYPVAASLDGNSGTAWSIDPQRGKNHAAVFEIESSQQTGFEGGTKLTFTLDFQFNNQHAIGRFRLSISADSAIFAQEQARSAMLKFTDPWAKLAAAYHILGDQPALDKLLKQHPAAVAGIGDLYAAAQDWERAIAEYRKVISDQTADGNLVAKLATAYQSAGRTCEAVPHLAKASAANPKDTLLSLKAAALQA